MVWIITFNRKFKFQRDKFLLQLAKRKVQKGKLLCTVMKERETNLLEHYLHFLHPSYSLYCFLLGDSTMKTETISLSTHGRLL